MALRVSVSSPWGRVRRKDRPVEIQGHTWKCSALEALDDQGGREVANVLDTLGVYVRKGTGDGGHGGQFAHPRKAANEGIVPIPENSAMLLRILVSGHVHPSLQPTNWTSYDAIRR